MSSSIFFDYISTIPLLIYGGLIYQSFCYREIHSILLAIYILFSDIVVYWLKRIPYSPDSYLYKITRRPKGATRCDYLSRNTAYPEYTPGFPSGHMTTTSLFCFFQIFKAYYTQYDNLYYTSILHIGIITLMGCARYYKKCHSLIQIIYGFILGTFMAWMYYHFVFVNLFDENYT